MSKRAYVVALGSLLEDPGDYLGRPSAAMQKLILLLHAECTLYLLSSQCFDKREEVEAWLNKWHIPFDKLYFKHSDYAGSDFDYKSDMVDKILSIGHDVEAYFDSDMKASEIVKSKGVETINISLI